MKDGPFRPLPALLAALVLGSALSLFFYFLGQRQMSLGLLAGSLFSFPYFQTLHLLSGRALAQGPQRGRKTFWSWNLARWACLAAAMGWAVSVSPTCLAGAGLGYFMFLLCLGTAGWLSIPKPK